MDTSVVVGTTRAMESPARRSSASYSPADRSWPPGLTSMLRSENAADAAAGVSRRSRMSTTASGPIDRRQFSRIATAWSSGQSCRTDFSR